MSKILIDKATIKLALDALQEVYWSSRSAKHDEAITALREALAEQPAQQEPVACPVCNQVHTILDADESQIIRNAKDGYPYGRTPRLLTLQERVTALCQYASDWKRWCLEKENTTPQAQPAPVPWSQALEAVWAEEDDPIGDAQDRLIAEQTAQAQPAPVQQHSTCNTALRAEGKAYPRTCKQCGLGPCSELARLNATKDTPPAQQEPVYHLKQYGDVTKEQLDRYMATGDINPQPAQQEPVAWMYQHPNNHLKTCYQAYKPNGECTPLYTSPPAQRKPLTDQEIDDMSRTMVKGSKSVNWLCRAIEAAHGIKEST